MISFEDLLILEAVSITAVLAVLFSAGFRPNGGREAPAPLLSPKLVPLLFAFVLVVAYLSIPVVGPTEYVFFLVESAVLATAALWVFTRGDPRTTRIAIVLVICTSIANGLATKFALGGTVWGEDERAYMLYALQIGTSGSFSPAQIGFYQIPVIPQLLYTLSSITSLPLGASLTVISSLFIAVFQATIYLLSSHFTRDMRVAFTIQVMTIFIPRLVIISTVIPEMISLVLAAVGIYLLMRIILLDAVSPRRDFALSMLLYLVVVISHPSGAIAVLAVVTVFTVAYLLRVSVSNAGFRLDILTTSQGLLRILLVLVATIATVYWTSLPLVEDTLASGFRSIFGRVLSFAVAPSKILYTPLYTQSGLQYTVTWSAPIAIASAYYLAKVFSSRREHWSKRDSVGVLFYVAGFLLVAGSFVILAFASTSGSDRYLGTPGYLLMVVSLVPPLSTVFSVGANKLLVATFLILLIGMIAVGPSLPDISPNSHAAIFEPPTSSSVQFYSSTLALYPFNSTIAAEKNFAPSISQTALSEIQSLLTHQYSTTYKTTRDLLGEIAAGVNSTAKFPGVFFVVDNSLLPGFLQSTESNSDIYFSSSEYALIGAQ